MHMYSTEQQCERLDMSWKQVGRHLVWKLAKLAVLAGVVYLVGAGLVAKYVHETTAPASPNSYTLQVYKDKYGDECDIAVVQLENEQLFATNATQMSYGSGYGADVLVAQINQAKEDDHIRGVLLEVDSPGGSPVGGEIIANALKTLGKPSAALIYDEGDSAAYFAATGASTIIASPFSSVGDIGVTSSFVDYSGSNTKAGNTFEQISSGKYKDAGNPDKPLTAEELALLQKNVDEEYQTLVGEIAQNRHMPVGVVTALADGAAIPGSEALAKGLVDQLGDQSTAASWFAKQLHQKNVVLCDPSQTE